MARDSLNAEIARHRQEELRRTAERHALIPEVPARARMARTRAQEAVTIRLAAADDGRELDLLARAQGAGMPAGPSLIAELGGRLVAAMSLLDRVVIVDPAERPTDAVELLRLRAAQLLGDSPRGRVSLRALARLPRGLLPR
jgi:hypothetical protein